MAEQPKYIELRPKAFNPDQILIYLDKVDKLFADTEIEYHNFKDQVQEVFDFVVSERMDNEKISVSLAKVKASNDKRYKEVKADFLKCHKAFLYYKIQSKLAHSYCENLKQQSINIIATEKLMK
jgi:predicted nucleic-acid-binding protein